MKKINKNKKRMTKNSTKMTQIKKRRKSKKNSIPSQIPLTILQKNQIMKQVRHSLSVLEKTKTVELDNLLVLRTRSQRTSIFM